MQSTIGLRIAQGNRFDHVIDSYAYIVAMAGDDIYEAEKGRAMAVETDSLLEKLYEIARLQGYSKEQVGITPDEEVFIAQHEGVLLVEDEYGRVETEWMENLEDVAVGLLCLYQHKHLSVASLATLTKE